MIEQYIRRLKQIGEHEIAAEMERLAAAQVKWISAETPPQKLCDEEGNLINYLVYMPEYGVDVACCVPVANIWVLLGLPVNVTHWAELPEAPREEAHG